jgi:hypothetical protein
MSLHLDVICEPHVPTEERKSQTVRVLAEVLPYVLAKYGISALSARCSADRADPRGSSPRFTLQ